MLSATKSVSLFTPQTALRPSRRVAVKASGSATDQGETTDTLGFKMMRRGVKQAASESVLTPRFYTTDFEMMDNLLNPAKNPNLNMEEMKALLNEFKTDYNQCHFVRNKTFKEAANTVGCSFGHTLVY